MIAIQRILLKVPISLVILFLIAESLASFIYLLIFKYYFLFCFVF